ncbi:DNA translocase FtsK [Oscillospiraceae bacterium HV4-5-C5C]|nr:DNA translocase FtsK [Oscillospiraceae bacterium HV4-5-C5C]
MYEINATEGQLMTDALAAWPQADGEPENEPLPVDASRPGSADSAEALNNPKVIAADAKTRILSPDQQKEPATESAETEKIELVSYKETKQLPRPERSALDSRRSRFFDIGEDQAGMNVMPSDEEQAYLNQAELEKLQQEQSDRETTAAFSQIPILSYDPETDSQPLADPLSTDHTPGYTAAPDSNRFVVPDFLQPAQNEAGSDRQTISLDDVLDEAMSEPWEADPEVPAVLDRTEPGQAEPGSRSVRSPQLPPSDSGAQSSVTANRYGKEIAVAGVRAVTAEQAQNGQNLPAAPQRPYRLPPAKLLNPDEAANTAQDRGQITAMGKKLEDTLHSFGVEAKVINITTGPAITRFELTPGVGVKVSRITNLSDDIALSLAAVGVRIEAPIPGKSAIGIEIPNKKTTAVLLRPLIESQSFRQAQSRLTVALGRDIPGAPILCDLGKMPHLLIAGATGSGKSVCINSILISLLYRCNPYEVKLLMIDPKVVELSVYNGIPHLLAPVVTDPKKAANTLNWAVVEMTKRYDLFAKKGVRDLASYNQAMKAENGEKLPLIILVIDELSDLMNTAPHEVEDAIARLTAMARAAGMHLIIATQRPSVDVITGVIKANIPSRIAFMVSSQVDSRTILDMSGAEKLLGKGDMLYAPQSAPKPIRGQGAFITEKEVERVVAFCKAQNTAGYDDDLAQEITTTQAAAAAGDNASDNDQDDMFNEAVETILDTGYASVSILQRRLNIGYPRAGKLIDAMERAGYIGPFEGSKPRKLLLTRVQWEQIKSQKEGQ